MGGCVFGGVRGGEVGFGMFIFIFYSLKKTP